MQYLFAPPPQIAGVSAPVLDFADVDVSPEVSARFGVLLRELRLSEDPQLILDAYRDVLLDDAFPLLARKAVTDDVENSEAVEILNKEVVIVDLKMRRSMLIFLYMNILYSG